MNDPFLGASLNLAQCLFVLPNKPILPKDEDGLEVLTKDIALLIELNGNHWRKIFTIMAKLTVPSLSNWRQFRDNELLNKVRIVFSLEQLNDYSGVVYLVGNSYREEFSINKQAETVGEKHLAYIDFPYIWCPYLDYRQFPNVLIDSLRERIMEK